MAGLDDAASELESIARHLRRAGETELVRELTRAIRDAANTVPDQILAGLKPRLPDPYAATLAEDLRLGVNIRTTGRDPGVTLTGDTKLGTGRGGVRAGGKARKLRRLDAGLLTHPVFGNREIWRTQRVTPGWFTGPAEDAAPRVRAEIEKALEDVAAKAASKGA